MTFRPRLSLHIILATFAAIVMMTSAACTGSKSLAHPGTYATAKIDQPKQNDSANVVTDKETADHAEKTKTSRSGLRKHDPDEVVVTEKVDAEKNTTKKNDHSNRKYTGGIDNIDSAAAVDDAIWRLFDLAEEYHAMGLLANRDASWEEAQYYFEKSLRILASLDIDDDSTMTPEAVKYDRLLDDVVSGYRAAMRSLGQLHKSATPSALVERFGELGDKLGRDTVVISNGERKEITYDLPVVMNDRVKSSLIYYQTVGREVFTKFLVRRKRYEKLFKDVLSEKGMPLDLVYLSMVESGYNPVAYSYARASGLWQFISSTGKMYGLKRNWWIDERRDPIKSTYAAVRFLGDLYKKFGNWDLAMAAYNGGPGRVSRTIKKQKTIDFWKMRLKRQTMDYVPLIYAATIISKDPERYGFYDIDEEAPIVWETVSIDRCLDLKVVAREIGSSLKTLKNLNPELLRNYTPPNLKKYNLKLPVGTKDKFLLAYSGMPSPKETSWVKHKIRRGETVSTIASRYGVSQYAIVEANNLKRRSRIFAGKTLIVPVPLDRNYSSKNKNRKYAADKGNTYAVRGGDTLWDIARAFKTSVSAIRRINYIERGSRIYVGQRLKLPANAKKASSKKFVSNDKNNKKNRNSTAPTPTVASGTNTYKVRRGDTLWDIARALSTTTSKIRQVNDLGRSSRIYPGQILKVPMAGTDYVVHRVKKGESLSRIAKRYRTSVSRILANNSMINPDALQIGDRLKIYTR